MKFECINISEVQPGTNLRNGETVIDCHLNDEGEYVITLEKWDATGVVTEHTMTHSANAYLRVVVHY